VVFRPIWGSNLGLRVRGRRAIPEELCGDLVGEEVAALLEVVLELCSSGRAPVEAVLGDVERYRDGDGCGETQLVVLNLKEGGPRRNGHRNASAASTYGRRSEVSAGREHRGVGRSRRGPREARGHRDVAGGVAAAGDAEERPESLKTRRRPEEASATKAARWRPPGAIPPAGVMRRTRRSSWTCWLGEGRPETAARRGSSGGGAPVQRGRRGKRECGGARGGEGA
jgi:hypothetical protein